MNGYPISSVQIILTSYVVQKMRDIRFKIFRIHKTHYRFESIIFLKHLPKLIFLGSLSQYNVNDFIILNQKTMLKPIIFDRGLLSRGLIKMGMKFL